MHQAHVYQWAGASGHFNFLAAPTLSFQPTHWVGAQGSLGDLIWVGWAKWDCVKCVIHEVEALWDIESLWSLPLAHQNPIWNPFHQAELSLPINGLSSPLHLSQNFGISFVWRLSHQSNHQIKPSSGYQESPIVWLLYAKPGQNIKKGTERWFYFKIVTF